MEKLHVNADSTDDLVDKDSNTDQVFMPIRVELADIVLPATSPPRPPLNNGSVAQPYVNQLRDNPQKRKNSPPQEPVTKKLCENLYEAIDDSSTDTEEYTITLVDDENNFQIKNYIEEGELLGDVVVKRDESNEVQMKFEKLEDYLKVTNKLKKEPTSESKLSLKSPKPDADLTDNGSDSTEVLQQSSWNSNEDVEYKDPLGLYGLQLEFLQSLEITPPLDRWVHVTNFRCDKTELRDVMELAGHVLSCSVIATTKRYAKVQYSHPLEAVQAVAMLNGQTLYGWKLSVYMERNPRNDIILPKGLVNIGIGLGIAGRPIRDIVSQYKKFTRKQTSTVNPVLFREFVSGDSKEGIQKQEESQIDFKALLDSKRPFEVTHVEDLDNADAVPSEKVLVKENISPETGSIRSSDSPVSYHEVKDEVKVDKSNDKPQNYSHPVSRAQPDVLGNTTPIRVRQTTPAVGFPRPIVAQNLRTQPLHSTPYRPGSSTTPVLMSSSQYPRPISDNSTPNARPISVPHPMPNPIGNPPTPGPFGLSQPCKPLSPTGPTPVNNPGPVYGLTSMYSPGVLPGPPLGIGHRPGPMHGPRPITGPGPVHLSNLAHGPGPNPGPSNLAHGPGPNQGPSNLALAPGPSPGPSSLAPGRGSNQGPSNLAHGPGPNQGPSHIGHGPGPNPGPSNLAPGRGPIQGPSNFHQGPFNLTHGPGPNPGPSNLSHGPGPNQGPSHLAHGPGPNPGPSNLAHAPDLNPGPSNLAHGPGPNPGPSNLAPGRGPNQGPSNLAHGLGPNQGPGPVQVSGPVSVTGAVPTVHAPNKVDVEFANLPPSTTFPFLCEKLAQCGQITCLRFTTPGCAIASFSHPAHAERCFQNYNGMVVEGFRIVVKLL
ncbi:unnamed protein product [Arctia plantaginis]|uniref:RRM domain-containing protein n=1 Tax=Arctia plantaginis TaxID=874455 RepID=A0A8S1B819_ARCPL|nr:unnamed protein product [Arctia plantaginis]CAB3253870.1 unnamed protein product [Arctia plantaginis]